MTPKSGPLRESHLAYNRSPGLSCLTGMQSSRQEHGPAHAVPAVDWRCPTEAQAPGVYRATLRCSDQLERVTVSRIEPVASLAVAIPSMGHVGSPWRCPGVNRKRQRSDLGFHV